jgi:hypothetical protein
MNNLNFKKLVGSIHILVKNIDIYIFCNSGYIQWSDEEIQSSCRANIVYSVIYGDVHEVVEVPQSQQKIYSGELSKRKKQTRKMDVQLHIMERKQNEMADMLSGLQNYHRVISPSRPRPVVQLSTSVNEIALPKI